MKHFMILIAFILGFSGFQTAYAGSENRVILDVRTAGEFSEGRVQGAINIDVLENDFKDKVGKLDKAKTYKVYCRSGNRSGRATQIMKSMGFTDVENVGSLEQAAKKLKLPCEGKHSCE